MLEIIALIFLCKMNGDLAARKGLKPLTWKLYTILAWIVAEVFGLMLGISMFDKTNLFGIFGVALFSAFGGYLFIRHTLECKPDSGADPDPNKDVKGVSIDDLAPPKK